MSHPGLLYLSLSQGGPKNMLVAFWSSEREMVRETHPKNSASHVRCNVRAGKCKEP